MTTLPQKIYLRKVRDFGQVFGATFGYIRQHFKSFFGSILLMAGPFALITGLFTSYFMSSVFKPSLNGIAGLEGIWTSYIVVLLVSMLGGTVFTTVVNQHLLLNEQMPNDQKPTIADVGRTFFGVYWRNLANWLLFTVVMVVGVLLIAVLFGIIVAAIVSISGVLGVILGVLLYVGFIFLVIPTASFMIINTFYVLQRDQIGLFEASVKVREYMRGHFWMTWLLALVSMIMTYMCMFICALPAYILMMISIFSRVKNPDGIHAGGDEFSILSYVLWSLSSILFFAVLAIFHLMCTFQYTNLEEKKDGKTILDKINAIS